MQPAPDDSAAIRPSRRKGMHKSEESAQESANLLQDDAKDLADVNVALPMSEGTFTLFCRLARPYFVVAHPLRRSVLIGGGLLVFLCCVRTGLVRAAPRLASLYAELPADAHVRACGAPTRTVCLHIVCPARLLHRALRQECRRLPPGMLEVCRH
eukprot:4141792-Prymnesium_polylepis.1